MGGGACRCELYSAYRRSPERVGDKGESGARGENMACVRGEPSASDMGGTLLEPIGENMAVERGV
eukprot:767359-Hanusia_phi.AAC.7